MLEVCTVASVLLLGVVFGLGLAVTHTFRQYFQKNNKIYISQNEIKLLKSMIVALQSVLLLF